MLPPVSVESHESTTVDLCSSAARPVRGTDSVQCLVFIRAGSVKRWEEAPDNPMILETCHGVWDVELVWPDPLVCSNRYERSADMSVGGTCITFPCFPCQAFLFLFFSPNDVNMSICFCFLLCFSGELKRQLEMRRRQRAVHGEHTLNRKKKNPTNQRQQLNIQKCFKQ